MSKIKKFFNSKAGQAIKSVGIGALKGFGGPVTGVVGGVFDEFKKEAIRNQESEVGGKGNIDLFGLLGLIGGLLGFVYLAYALFTGLITFDQFLSFFESLVEVSE